MSRRLASRRLLVAGTAAVALATPLAVASVQASADSSPSPLGLSCTAQTSPDGVGYTLCSGKVPSFDEVKPQLAQRMQGQVVEKYLRDLRAKNGY